MNDYVISFLRYAENNAPYLIVINFGPKPYTDDYTLAAGVLSGKVVAHAHAEQGMRTPHSEGERVGLDELTLVPGEGIVVLLMED